MKDYETKNSKIITNNEVPYVIFKPWENHKNLIHAFTTKKGGVSVGDFESLNLGCNRGDQKEKVMQNYERLAKSLGIEIGDFVLSNQTHETTIVKVTKTDRGNGILYNHKWESVDGLYTDEKQVALLTHYADCVPLFFYAPKHQMIGLAHAGWRGTVADIGGKMIKEWEALGIPAPEIEVGIGPSIGECCFEVGEEVARIFLEKFGETSFITCHEQASKYRINLWEANETLLQKQGILKEKIYKSEMCTCCHSSTFFSHRKTKGKRGTLGAIMCLA